MLHRSHRPTAEGTDWRRSTLYSVHVGGERGVVATAEPSEVDPVSPGEGVFTGVDRGGAVA